MESQIFCQSDIEKLALQAEIFSLMSCSSHTSETSRDRRGHTSVGDETCEAHWGQLCFRLCLSEDLETERNRMNMAERHKDNMNKSDLLCDG